MRSLTARRLIALRVPSIQVIAPLQAVTLRPGSGAPAERGFPAPSLGLNGPPLPQAPSERHRQVARRRRRRSLPTPARSEDRRRGAHGKTSPSYESTNCAIVVPAPRPLESGG